MKTTLLTIALTAILTCTSALAHEGLKLGPNGGHMLKFSKDESLHGEVTAKDGTFRIALVDKAQKPVAIDKQTLTASTADRSNPQKLTVTVKDNAFEVPMQKGEEFWTIFQFKPSPDAKPVTARLHYDNAICSGCKKAEWLCECKPEGKKEKK